MSRGVGGMDIFGSDDERAEFLAILADVALKTGAHVLAYCLMSNHFHLFIETGRVPLEVVMRRLLNRYARRFNLRRNRKGHVFQARYLAKLVQTDEYYGTVLAYIHNNPVKAGLVEDPADWPWSSHRQYVGQIRSTLVDVERGLARLGATREEALRRYRELIGTRIDPEAITFDERPLAPEDPPSPAKVSLDEIAARVNRSAGVDVVRTPSSRRNRALARARKEFANLALEAGYRVAEIARFLGVSVGAVSHAIVAAMP